MHWDWFLDMYYRNLTGVEKQPFKKNETDISLSSLSGN